MNKKNYDKWPKVSTFKCKNVTKYSEFAKKQKQKTNHCQMLLKRIWDDLILK